MKCLTIGALLLLLTGCSNTLRSFINYAEARRVSSCIEAQGAMRGNGGIGGGQVAVKVLTATGGADLDQCFELMR